MIIYFTIGLVMYMILQFVSTKTVMDSQRYRLLKCAAWLSLIVWPLVILALIALLIILAIEYIDSNIDRITRKKK